MYINVESGNIMRIIDIITGKKPSLSFEVFPPKSFNNFDAVKSAVCDIAAIKPGYMSVTYGAGGTTDVYTPEISALIASLGVTPLAHLTCVGADKEKVIDTLGRLKSGGVNNILALRGDIPEGVDKSDLFYHYASELVSDIRDFGGFCIGGACYPEGHPESPDRQSDIENLKKKIDAGCQFLTTQMFFDNGIMYKYMDALCKTGINVPVVPGIMPITNINQIKRIVSISGNALPERFMRVIDRYADSPDDMKRAGISYATEQIVDLYERGFNAVHVYSMNKPDVAAAIQNNVSSIIEKEI